MTVKFALEPHSKDQLALMGVLNQFPMAKIALLEVCYSLSVRPKGVARDIYDKGT